MSQLVPYHLLSSEQDDSLMFATMFDYQTDEYNKPVRFPYLVFEDISAISDLMINTLALKDRAVHNAGRLASGAGVSGCTGAGWGRRRRRGASRQAYQPAAGPRASLTPHSAAGRALAPHAPAPRPKPLSGRAIIFTYVLRTESSRGFPDIRPIVFAARTRPVRRNKFRQVRFLLKFKEDCLCCVLKIGLPLAVIAGSSR
ncbi:hypothetical protein RR46_13652 [Papilio xuthus]|uniref:Uncharacterized protein n=1 Tax=Papilio xuthus TaxID=66420 RepID=A0A194PGB6_PAPXU|nr:hypothetical protein RR46_13652 [Papilio xuthus]